jgi:hypothetical protein
MHTRKHLKKNQTKRRQNEDRLPESVFCCNRYSKFFFWLLRANSRFHNLALPTTASTNTSFHRRIANCFEGGLSVFPIAPPAVTGSQVLVNSTGKLGVTTSSKRFKEAIKPMDKASEAILALKPVTFHYKKEIDPDGIPQFGLIAEQVEKVNPDLVARDADGKVNTVRYEAVNAMLLNEFLKVHRKVEEQEAAITQLKSIVSKQEAIIAQQQKGMEVFAARLDQQAAQIQKVSAQLEVNKTASQFVNNP